MSVLSVILRDRNVEVSKSAMIICNSAHAYGLLYLSLKGKVPIYLYNIFFDKVGVGINFGKWQFL